MEKTILYNLHLERGLRKFGITNNLKNRFGDYKRRYPGARILGLWEFETRAEAIHLEEWLKLRAPIIKGLEYTSLSSRELRRLTINLANQKPLPPLPPWEPKPSSRFDPEIYNRVISKPIKRI